MSRSYYSGSSRSPMDEYLKRITKMLKTPSVIPDFPDFPNVYKALNNNNNKDQENHPKKMSYVNHKKHQAPEAHKKVHSVESEYKDIAVDDPDGNDFIQQNRKSFALCKWYTYSE